MSILLIRTVLFASYILAKWLKHSFIGIIFAL